MIHYKPEIFHLTENVVIDTITINSGFTLNINDFSNNIILKNDIIDNVVNYVDEINKFSLNVKIFNESLELDKILSIGNYYIQLYYDNINKYIYLNIQDNIILINDVTTTTTTTTTIAIPIINKNPIIFYNSGITWVGGGLVTPHDIYLSLYHDNLTGWTSESLYELLVYNISGCYGSIQNPIVKIYEKGSNVIIYDIVKNGIYDLNITAIDNAQNITISTISNLFINDDLTKIYYKQNIFSNITGNTSLFTGGTFDITGNINIESGFTFNIGGFKNNIISKIDIIDNIINYIDDLIFPLINKYMINILIVGKSHRNRNIIEYENINKPGQYCIKISLTNPSNITIINYFIMNVIFDISVYSEGYWQDNKVWINFNLWLDHPIFKR